MYIYITGDRSTPPLAAAGVVSEVLSHLINQYPVSELQFITSNAPTGIEKAVRYLLPDEVLTVVKRGLDSAGHLDFDATNKLISLTADMVIVLHPDPMASRVTQSVARIFDPAIVMYPVSDAISSIAVPEDFNADGSTEEK